MPVKGGYIFLPDGYSLRFPDIRGWFESSGPTPDAEVEKKSAGLSPETDLTRTVRKQTRSTKMWGKGTSRA
jgi:hypothetical protein